MVGIDKTKEILSTLARLLADSIMLTKGGLSFSNMARIMAIFSEIRGIVADSGEVLEELRDLDATEASELAQLSLELVQDLIGSVLAHERKD